MKGTNTVQVGKGKVEPGIGRRKGKDLFRKREEKDGEFGGGGS